MKFFLQIVVSIFFLLTAPQILLGTFQKLNFTNFILVELIAVPSAIILLSRFRYKRKHLKGRKLIIIKDKTISLVTVLLGIFFSSFFALRFFIATTEIPTNFDAMVYHLPIAVEWLRSGNIWDVFYSAFATPLGFYPNQFELILSALIMPLNGDYLVNFINFVLLPLVGLAFFAITRNIRVNTCIVIFLSAIFISLPFLINELGHPKNDIFFLLAFLLTIFFIHEFIKTRSFEDLLFASISIGFFIGTKSIGLVFGFPLIILLFVLVFSRKFLQKRMITILLMLFFIIISGGIWYIRNWIVAGNPLFPVEISMGNLTIFKGYGDLTGQLKTSSLLSNIHTFEDIWIFIKTFSKTIGPSVLIIILGLVGLIVKIFNKKTAVKSKYILLAIFACCVYLFIFYWIAPFSYQHLAENVRYNLPLIAVIFLASASFFSANRLATKLLGIFCCFVVAINIISIKDEINLRLIDPISSSSREVNRDKVIEFYYKGFPKYYQLFQAAEFFNKNNISGDIATAGFHFIYPFYGKNLERHANYVNINECALCKHEDFIDSSDSIRQNPNYENWFKNLKAQNKSYLVTYLFNGYLWEKEWALAHPENFQLIKVFGEAEIYKISYHE